MNLDIESIFLCIFILAFFLLLVFEFFAVFVVRRFILKRYEEETNLAATEQFFYNNWFMGAKYYRVLFYSGHLTIVTLLSEKWLKKSPAFKNSPSRDEIMSHFSRKERVLTIIMGASGIFGAFLMFSSIIALKCLDKQ